MAKEQVTDYELFKNKDVDGIINKYMPLIKHTSYVYYDFMSSDHSVEYEDLIQENMIYALKAIDRTMSYAERGKIDENFKFGTRLKGYLKSYNNSAARNKRKKMNRSLVDIYEVHSTGHSAVVRFDGSEIINNDVYRLYEMWKETLKPKAKKVLKLLEKKMKFTEIAQKLNFKSPSNVAFYKTELERSFVDYFKKHDYFSKN